MTIIDAMIDQRLFGPFFQGSEWKAWRAFLAGLFGLPMGPNLRAIYDQHTRRSVTSSDTAKEGWMVVGRRGGKSRIAAFLATYTACFRDYHPHLAPGELALIPVLASDKDQAQAIFSYVLAFLSEIKALRPLLVGKPTSERVVLRTGVEIKVRAATFRGLRGRAIPLVLADEIAFWRNEESRNPDHEILRALRPGMLTIPGSMLIGLSSPYARRGVLWEQYEKHFGKDSPRVFVWQADTLSMNPTADRDEIAKAYEDDPVAAAAEYGGNFRDDVQAYVPREKVDACVVKGRTQLPYRHGVTYVAFCDPSGGSQDSMTLAIAHYENGRSVLDCVLEVRPPFAPSAVVAEFCRVLKDYRVFSVRGDRYAGEWPRERFGEHGVNYEPCDESKSDLYVAFLPQLMSQQTELLDDRQLIRQLCDLDRKTSRAGKDSIDHPPAGHDDVANACAGALVDAMLMDTSEPEAVNLAAEAYKPVEWGAVA